MLAQKDDIFEETCETVFKLNQDDKVRYICEMREEGQRITQTYKSIIAQKDSELAEKDSELAEKDAALAENASTIAENASTIAEMRSTIATLQAKLNAYEK